MTMSMSTVVLCLPITEHSVRCIMACKSTFVRPAQLHAFSSMVVQNSHQPTCKLVRLLLLRAA